MAIAKFSLASSKFNGQLEFVMNYAWKDVPAGKKTIEKCQLVIGGIEKECELRFTSGRGQSDKVQYYVYIVIPSEKFAAYNVKFSLNYENWTELKDSTEFVITELKKNSEESEEKPVEKTEEKEPELIGPIAEPVIAIPVRKSGKRR